MLKHGSSKRRGIAKVIALAAVFSAIGATGTVDAASRPTVTVTVDDGDGGGLDLPQLAGIRWR